MCGSTSSSNSTSTSTPGLLVNCIADRKRDWQGGRQAGRQVDEPHADRAVDYLVLFSGIGIGDTRMNMDEKLHGDFILLLIMKCQDFIRKVM